jgi:hypothetical protein
MDDWAPQHLLTALSTAEANRVSCINMIKTQPNSSAGLPTLPHETKN